MLLSDRDVEFLGRWRIGRLATADGSGVTHVVPIWYVVKDGFVVMATDDGTKKIRNIRVNPSVALVVDNQDWERPSHVMVSGSAEVLDQDHPEYRGYFEGLVEKYPQEKEYDSPRSRIIRVTPKKTAHYNF